MVQSLNTKAILTLSSVLRRPGLMTPHISVPNVSELDYVALRRHAGIQAVVFDKDHTLTAPYDTIMHPHAVIGLQSCLAVFGSERVAILSNSAGTLDDVDGVDALRVEASLGVSVIRHTEKKPGGLTEVLQHFHLQDPAQICMVGDRLLTDVVFGNLHGMLTVHTQAFADIESKTKDNWTARLLRPMENAILYRDWFGGRALGRRKLAHKYWLGPGHSPLILPKSVNANSDTR